MSSRYIFIPVTKVHTYYMCEYLRSEAFYNYMPEIHICVPKGISSQIFINFLQAIYQKIFSTAKS